MSEYKHIKGFSKLSEGEKELFIKVHQKHLRAWGSEERKKEHSAERIKEIKRNVKENCFNVYYENVWYHYYANGTWG